VSRVPVRVVVGSAAPAEGWAALRPRACPCCVGRVQLQVELARLLRNEAPRGVLIELVNASHLDAVRRALAERPLSDYVAL
jgi:hypothetical protein